MPPGDELLLARLERRAVPTTNTKPFALIACEYGAPWNGAGAPRCGRPPSSRSSSVRGRHAWPIAAPSALKIAASTCSGSLAFEDADVDVEACAGRELVEEPRDDVAREAADALAGEVDVRDDERPLGDLEHGACERLVGRQPGPPATRRARRPERARRARSPSAAAGGGDLLVGAARRDLEREPEARSPGELAEQVVEDGQPRGDARAPFGRELDANACLRPGHSPVRVSDPRGRTTSKDGPCGR